MNASEQILWGLIRKKQLGFLFRRQHPIGSYALDFYCPEAKLCVEIDGEVHALRQGRDETRDADLLNKGIATIRIPSLNLFDCDSPQINFWLREIVTACEERTGRKAFDGLIDPV